MHCRGRRSGAGGSGAGRTRCGGIDLRSGERAIPAPRGVLRLHRSVRREGARALARGGRAVLSVWTRELSDGSVAVALYNENDASIDVALEFASLATKHGARWSATTTAVVRDLWEFTNATVTGRFPARGALEVTAHRTILLRLFPGAQ